MKNTQLEIFDTTLKVQILRQWQKANRAEDPLYSDREFLVLELANSFSPITEKSISKIFGVPFSSVADIVARLGGDGLIESKKARGQPLTITTKGKECLVGLKKGNAARLDFLFEGLGESDIEALGRILDQVDQNAQKYVEQVVFGRSASVDLGALV